MQEETTKAIRAVRRNAKQLREISRSAHFVYLSALDDRRIFAATELIDNAVELIDMAIRSRGSCDSIGRTDDDIRTGKAIIRA